MKTSTPVTTFNGVGDHRAYSATVVRTALGRHRVNIINNNWNRVVMTWEIKAKDEANDFARRWLGLMPPEVVEG